MSGYERFVYVEATEEVDEHIIDEADGMEYYTLQGLCELLNDKQGLTDYLLKKLEYENRMHNKWKREALYYLKEIEEKYEDISNSLDIEKTMERTE